jgi:hypothetical protein
MTIKKDATFNPGDWRYVGAIYFGKSEALHDAMQRDIETDEARQLLEEQGKPCGPGLKKCEHCGMPFAYGIVYRHVVTGEAGLVGHVCSSTEFGFSSRVELDVARLKKRAAAARERVKKIAAAHTFIAEHPGLEAALTCAHPIVQSIKTSLFEWGSLTEKQLPLVMKLWQESQERAARQAEREATRPHEPAPEGPCTIEGEVVSLKCVEGYMRGSEVLKMVVRDDRGFAVWCTVPTAIEGDGLTRGARVRFTATVERSKQDAAFGFAKRPRAATLLARAPVKE